MILADQEILVVARCSAAMRVMSCSGVHAFGLRLDHHWRAVGVLGADINAVMPLHALKAHPDVGLHGFDDVSEMQRAVGIR